MTHSTASPLISAPELDAALGRAGSAPIVIDTRPSEHFANAHIPGAIHLDLWAFSLNDTNEGPLRSFLWMMQHVLEARGIDPRAHLVVYDEQTGLRAARLFWLLEYFGAVRAQVLDGGWCSWLAAGLPASTTASPREAVAWSEALDAPEVRPEVLASWRDVQEALGRDGAIILDTRSDDEYLGRVARARRGGAVPGAVHLEWARALDEQGRLRPLRQLRAMYAAAGVTPDRDVLTYCQGGYRAAHAYLALRALGHPRVRSYVGSWREWGDRTDLPIEVPSAV